MINLIPEEEKSKIIHGYNIRLASVYLWTLFFCISLLLVSLLPSYFLSREKEKYSLIKLEDAKALPGESLDEVAVKAVNDTNKELLILEKTKNLFAPSRIFGEILGKKTSQIRILDISYEKNSQGELSSGVSGFADNREALIFFKKSLESDTMLSSVSLPISDFVSGRDLSFELSAKIKQ